MTLFGLKLYPPLLWGVCLLLSGGATSAPITDPHNISSTVTADPAARPRPPGSGRQNETEGSSGPTHEPADATATPHGPAAPAEVITNTPIHLLHTVPVSQTTASDQPAHHGNETVQPPPVSTATSPPETPSLTPSLTPGTTSPTTTTASPTSEGPATATPSSQGGSTTGTDTLGVFSTVSPDGSPEVPSLIHNLSSPAVPDTSSVMVNATTGSPPVFKQTSSFPERRTEMFTTTTGSTFPPPTQKPVSATTPSTSTSTSAFPDSTKLQSTDESSSANASTSTFTTAVASNHSGGILVPVSPTKSPVPTSQSVTAVTKPPESPSTAGAQSCSVRGVVKQCLIAVAALGALASIFMVSTVILCTRLSVRKYRVRKPQQATEMMCISALLPERNHNHTRPRNPFSNGVLVIPSGADSDDDGGDNLTLSSFLPENDRLV